MQYTSVVPTSAGAYWARPIDESTQYLVWRTSTGARSISADGDFATYSNAALSFWAQHHQIEFCGPLECAP